MMIFADSSVILITGCQSMRTSSTTTTSMMIFDDTGVIFFASFSGRPPEAVSVCRPGIRPGARPAASPEPPA
jgi:hypothetical protein